MRSTQSAIAPPTLLLLAACATSSDPAQGGFISGVNGLLSGGYNQRIAAQQQELNSMRAQQMAAQASADQSRATLAQHQQALVNLRNNVARLDRSLRDIQGRVAQQRAQNVSLSDKDRQLASDLERAKARLAKLQEQLQSTTSDEEYEAARKEYLSLQTAIAALSEQLKGS
jgi:chromosome segregation ATPase